jgi:hypothetical protein
MDRPGGLSAIGNTPVVRLARMAGADSAEVELIPSPGHRVVTPQVDSGLKYLSGPLYSRPHPGPRFQAVRRSGGAVL